MENEKIYIILSYTGTILSKIVRLFTRAKYAHSSISLDKDLENMYSFGRRNPYNPLIGGFVHESPKWGTFKRFKNTKSIIFSLEITKEQYKIIEDEINKFKKESKKYRFNMPGVVLSAFKYKYKMKNRYYCSEFVKYLLDKADLNLELNDIVRPMDFLNIKNKKVIYEGLLKEYINF